MQKKLTILFVHTFSFFGIIAKIRKKAILQVKYSIIDRVIIIKDLVVEILYIKQKEKILLPWW